MDVDEAAAIEENDAPSNE